MRDSRESANTSIMGDYGYHDHIMQVAEDFDLKEFMDGNKIPRSFVRDPGSGRNPLGLAIHDFH